MEFSYVSTLVGKSNCVNKQECKLVPMSYEHIDKTCDWLQDESLRKNIDCILPPTTSQNKKYWDKKLNSSAHECYAILNDANEHIGNCGLSNICTERKKAELWIYIMKSKGLGFGKKSVDNLLRRAFHELKLNRVFLRVIEGNIIAENMYKKAGFVYEGRSRQDSLWNNQHLDSNLYSILSSEYRKSPSNLSI